jgi:hypothetical protein
LPRKVDAEDQLGHFPAGEAAQGLLAVGTEGLAPDMALHLQRLRLQASEVFVRKHDLPVLKDVDYRSFFFYAGFDLLAKAKFNKDARSLDDSTAQQVLRESPLQRALLRERCPRPECGTCFRRKTLNEGHFRPNAGHPACPLIPLIPIHS